MMRLFKFHGQTHFVLSKTGHKYTADLRHPSDFQVTAIFEDLEDT